MSKRDQSKKADRKPGKSAARDNTAGISDSLRDLSNDKARIAAEFMQESAENVNTAGRVAIANLGKRVRAKPGRSLGLAFAAGLVVSYLLGRR